MTRHRADTSVQYHELDVVYLKGLQHDVCECIAELGPICNRDIADVIERPINVITPRCLALREKGLVVLAFTAAHPDTNHPTMYWKLAPAVTIEERA